MTFLCCDIALTVFSSKDSIWVCTLCTQIKFIGWNVQLRLFCRWIQSPGDTRIRGDHLEAFSPVICNTELLTMEHNLNNRKYSCKDRLSFNILTFVLLLCPANMSLYTEEGCCPPSCGDFKLVDSPGCFDCSKNPKAWPWWRAALAFKGFMTD